MSHRMMAGLAGVVLGFMTGVLVARLLMDEPKATPPPTPQSPMACPPAPSAVAVPSALPAAASPTAAPAGAPTPCEAQLAALAAEKRTLEATIERLRASSRTERAWRTQT